MGLVMPLHRVDVFEGLGLVLGGLNYFSQVRPV